MAKLETKIMLDVECVECEEVQQIVINKKDKEAWEAGAHIQHVMPYLDKYQREMLISKICNKCWIKLFGSEE